MKYQKGCNNPADYLSRHPEENKAKSNFTEFCINHLIDSCLPSSILMKDLILTTKEDEMIQTVMGRMK